MTETDKRRKGTISLADKYEKDTGQIYLTGIQSLVRLPLDRIRMDRANGLNIGGFISGYRGSPIGTYDQQLGLAKKYLDEHSITFIPGVNEELAATAVWGTQKVGLAGQGSNFDGVVGLWYGKAPGVDRSCDAFRHANFSGTARHGGVLAVAGDDPLAKSSTVVCQSEMAFIDVEIPVFTPSDIQDVLDLGLHAYSLSRFAGVWTGMIALADMMDASARINVDPGRLNFRLPDASVDPRAAGEMNRVMALAGRGDHEITLRELRLPAVREYVRVNELNRVTFGAEKPRFGLIAAGKAYRDLIQALKLLGIDSDAAAAMGLGVFKVAVSWPLEPFGLKDFAQGLDRLMVVEHKRAIMEPQIKEQAYCWPEAARPAIWGKVTPEGETFLPSVKEISSFDLVPALLDFLPNELVSDQHRAVAERLQNQVQWAADNASDSARIPYFCSGCPHSSSTVVPEGSRVLAGIGCHSMTEATGRITDSLAMMGGEGMQWVGQQPFDKDKHVFVNLGDGTYFHSGSMAIRQAVAAKVPITYKILYNDVVAMTGGQAVDGVLTVPKITHQLKAEGVERTVIVSERPELYGSDVILASGVEVRHRDRLVETEKELAAYGNVSVLIYDQTCAAEKRRRRKRGLYEIPNKRLFINDRICEACGDCSVQSNCLSVEPLATEFGEKRAINQSSCNLDFTCVKGHCPSFVWVEDAQLRKADAAQLDPDALVAGLPKPKIQPLDDVVNVLVAGIGGMGVTTIAAVLAMAAHIDGVKASTVDMTGIAQKGGPVTSHLRLAPDGMDIEGPRIPVASMDVLLGGDMLVAANQESLSMMASDRTFAVCNGQVAPTAEFVLHQTLSFDAARLRSIVEKASKECLIADTSRIAEQLLGDSLYTNMILIGMAWQNGVLPLSAGALAEAIQLNGAAVDNNMRAFAVGRALAGDEARVLSLLPEQKRALERQGEELASFYETELAAYQSKRYARRYRQMVEKVKAAEIEATGAEGPLTEAVIEQLYRLMAIKDEYEVARLMLDDAFTDKLGAKFSDYSSIKMALAPSFLPGIDAKTGHVRKRVFGGWMWRAMRILRSMRKVRGSVFDPFAYQGERKEERRWLKTYMQDLAFVCDMISSANAERMIPLVKVPESIRGFGPIKMARMKKAEAVREKVLAEIKDPEGQSHVREAALKAAS